MLLTEKEGRDLVRLRDEGNCEDCSEWKQMCRKANARAKAMKQYLQREQRDPARFCYRRRLLMIAADDVSEREWQQIDRPQPSWPSLQRALPTVSPPFFAGGLSGMCDKNFLHTLFSAVAQLYDNC